MEKPAPPRLRYQDQDCPLTLGEGLAEYYAANVGRVRPPGELPAGSAALFHSHDQCHVIFGLDTSLADEVLADTRTLLSCDVGWPRYIAYLNSDPQAKALFVELGLWRAAAASLAAIPRIARAVTEAARMRRKWPWTPPADWDDRPLSDLRREFAIRVI